MDAERVLNDIDYAANKGEPSIGWKTSVYIHYFLRRLDESLATREDLPRLFCTRI